MPYNADLDENIFAKSFETESGRLTVSVYCYNKGAKKLQVTRENRDSEGEFRFTKLGRMTKQEVEALIPLFQEALKHM